MESKSNAKSTSPAEKYIQSATSFAKHLEDHPEALKKLEEIYHKLGYPALSLKEKWFPRWAGFQVLNYDDFQRWLRIESVDNVNSDRQYASFKDDGHAIFIDITDMDSPKMVESPDNRILFDYEISWDNVEKLPTLFPSGNVILVHVDMDFQKTRGELFFPIPTVSSGGRRKTRKQKKRAKKHAKKRSMRRKH